jgi:hypothetical protein
LGGLILAWERKKYRYTPMEVARKIGLSTGKFNEQVSQGSLPKGRMGDDGRRYYTDKDLEFILRDWKTKTTSRFFFVTLPLILVIVFIAIATFREISEHVSRMKAEADATPRPGFAAPPAPIWAPGTPWPTREPQPTPRREIINNYRKQRRAQESTDIEDDIKTSE